jgi:hypothetical protein
MDLALTNRALEQYYNLGANGGNEQIRYFASIGYTDIEGTFIDSYYNRFTARANVDFRIRSNLKLTTRLDHATSSTNDIRSQRQVFKPEYVSHSNSQGLHAGWFIWLGR